MGASYVSRSYPGCTIAELRDHINSSIDEAGFTSGRGAYSGDWGSMHTGGMIIIERPFFNASEADNYIQDQAVKHGPFVVARIFEPVKVNTTALDRRIEALHLKSSKIRKLLGHGRPYPDPLPNTPSIRAAALERIKKTKSSLKTCTACTSKIATQHIKAANCPVCNNEEFLLTQTEIQRVIELKEKLALAESEKEKTQLDKKALIDHANSKQLTSAAQIPSQWLVGALCPS